MVRLYFGLYGRSCIGSVVSQLNLSSGCIGGKSSSATTVSLRVVPEDFYNYVLSLVKQHRHRGHSVDDILVRQTWIGTISSQLLVVIGGRLWELNLSAGPEIPVRSSSMASRRIEPSPWF